MPANKTISERYVFDRREIAKHPLHQIEYSIVDVCNRNCRSCSHFAPLAKKPNYVSVAEFIKNAGILHEVIPDIHTFWLIGGEPTLHPEYPGILKALRRIYSDIPIGVMSNGAGLTARRDDPEFWKFVRDNEIVWHITTYDVHPDVYAQMFIRNGCLNLLSLDINNAFTNLTSLTEAEQTVSVEKYNYCGWERLNIFVRNGRIWKCPSAEYIDLFNGYFDKHFMPEDGDSLAIDEHLTRKRIVDFQNRPSSFCRYCNISARFKEHFPVSRSERLIGEWMAE